MLWHWNDSIRKWIRCSHQVSLNVLQVWTVPSHRFRHLYIWTSSIKRKNVISNLRTKIKNQNHFLGGDVTPRKGEVILTHLWMYSLYLSSWRHWRISPRWLLAAAVCRWWWSGSAAATRWGGYYVQVSSISRLSSTVWSVSWMVGGVSTHPIDLILVHIIWL